MNDFDEAAEREAFENYFQERCPWRPYNFSRDERGYRIASVDNEWRVWLASAAARTDVPALADTALYWQERVKELTEALTPFASVELMPMRKDGTKPQDVYLWKPSSNTRDMLGINAAHILEARRVLSQLPAVAKDPQP